MISALKTSGQITLFNNYSPEVEVIIGEYSPRRSRGEYLSIITEPEANNCINTHVIISKKRKKNISTRNHLHLQWQNDYWQPFCPSR